MPLQRLENCNIDNNNPHRNMMERQQYPFFSSTLLDKIYSSMDEGCEAKLQDPTFYRKTFYMKETRTTSNGFHQAASVQKQSMQRRRLYSSSERKPNVCPYLGPDPLSSGSCSSSESSESTSSDKTRAPSCFAPFGLKPVRVSAAAEKHRKTKQSTLFQELKAEDFPQRDEEGGSGLMRSKALKIYNNLKKVKQPISPGGRLSSLIGSLFNSSSVSSNNCSTKKNKKSSLGEGKVQKEQPPTATCTSASSFARSCLSKNSPSTREKIKNRDKRMVRFYPVIVAFDGDSRPCSRKWLYEEERKSEDSSRPMSVLVPKEWKIKRSQDTNHRDHKKGFEVKGRSDNYSANEEEEEDMDDAESCSSSDLFELDHLSVIGIKGSELPVYKSTRVGPNRDMKL